jgi:hypothetical protein
MIIWGKCHLLVSKGWYSLHTSSSWCWSECLCTRSLLLSVSCSSGSSCTCSCTGLLTVGSEVAQAGRDWLLVIGESSIWSGRCQSFSSINPNDSFMELFSELEMDKWTGIQYIKWANITYHDTAWAFNILYCPIPMSVSFWWADSTHFSF